MNVNTINSHNQATSTIESFLKNHSKSGHNSFNEFKTQFNTNNIMSATNHHINASGSKTYKLMKSAERGEINTHNFVMCSRHNQDGTVAPCPS